MVGCAASPSGDGSDGASGKDGAPGADGASGPAGPPGASAVQSGSRLKAVSWVADDGAKAQLPYVWFDADTGVRCAFGMAADGKSRCLPTSSGMTPLYADAACSSLAFVQLLKDCSVNGFAQTEAGAGCALTPMSEVHKIGAPLDPTEAYFLKSGNQCTSWNLGPAFLYFADGGIVAPSEFVAATIETDP